MPICIGQIWYRIEFCRIKIRIIVRYWVIGWKYRSIIRVNKQILNQTDHGSFGVDRSRLDSIMVSMVNFWFWIYVILNLQRFKWFRFNLIWNRRRFWWFWLWSGYQRRRNTGILTWFLPATVKYAQNLLGCRSFGNNHLFKRNLQNGVLIFLLWCFNLQINLDYSGKPRFSVLNIDLDCLATYHFQNFQLLLLVRSKNLCFLRKTTFCSEFPQFYSSVLPGMTLLCKNVKELINNSFSFMAQT